MLGEQTVLGGIACIVGAQPALGRQSLQLWVSDYFFLLWVSIIHAEKAVLV